MYRYIYSGLLLLCFQYVYTQSAAIDSLVRLLKSNQSDSSRCDLIYSLIVEFENVDADKAMSFTDSLYHLAQKIKYKKLIAQALIKKGRLLKENGDIKNSIYNLHQSLSILHDLNDSINIGKAYNDIGAAYAEAYMSDSTIKYYLQNLDIQLALKNYKNVASAYANIGNLYADMKLHEKGIEYLKKALQTRIEHGDEKGSSFTYNNLAVAFGGWDKPDSAIYYSLKGIEIAQKYNNALVEGVIYGGLSQVYKDKGDYSNSISSAQNSIRILTKANRKPNLVYPYVNLGTVYNILNKPEEALKYLNTGYAIMKELNLLSPLEVYYEELAKAYELKGNHKESLKWFKEFIKLDDSLFKSENNKILSETEAKYQSQKKETEIVHQKLVLADQQKQLLHQRLWIGGLIGSLALISLLYYAYWNRYKRKKKEELDAAIIQEQRIGLRAVIDAQEEERKRVAKDLHDGVAQEMVAIKLGINALEQKIKNQWPEQFENVHELSDQIDAATTEIRTLAHVMLPPALESKGLAASLETLCHATLKNAGVQYQIHIEGITEPINDKVKIGLYRIAQELINNIVKHSQANKVMIALTLTGSALAFQIEDDGKGYNFEESKNKGSMGLLNIVSRVSTMGGSIDVKNVDPHGSKAEIKIPIS